MSNLVNSTNWTGNEEITKKNSSLTLNTAKKYVDRNIELDINIPGINLNNSETFYINDGIYTWNWNIDSNGNVTIT